MMKFRTDTQGSSFLAILGFVTQSLWDWALCLLLLSLCGCATSQPVPSRRFNFQKDTVAFANELTWEYHYGANGKWTTEWRRPPPDYSQHCFVVARTVRQFFLNARFAPEEAKVDEDTYKKLIRRIVATSPRHGLVEDKKIVIPGYGDLRTFTREQEPLFKSECGGRWQSYVQRGHWRMVFPFTRHGQEKMAVQILAHLKQNEPVVVHIVRFPQLTINHAIILFDAEQTPEQIRFIVYDPNRPESPKTLNYTRVTRTFDFEANSYFPGGRVDVYEVYRGWVY
jgi:hypothetical protein